MKGKVNERIVKKIFKTSNFCILPSDSLITHSFTHYVFLPLQIFYPETTDVYDRKNMPRVVFCLHALSLYLFRLGIAPQIQNLYGKVMFSGGSYSVILAYLFIYLFYSGFLTLHCAIYPET